MARFFYICLGGAAGTGARYLLSGWLLRVAGPAFPWGTLAVNVPVEKVRIVKYSPGTRGLDRA
jgi:fluoride ion exporter CrcB/FEX